MPNEKKAGHRHLTAVQFYQVCEYLKENKERMLKEKPSSKDTEKEVSENLKFPVSLYSIRSAQEATGILWISKRKSGSPNGGRQDRKRNNAFFKLLTKAVRNLYWRLGEQCPEVDLLLRILEGSSPLSDLIPTEDPNPTDEPLK